MSPTQDPKTGRKIVSHLPLLVIDDEADHASVDTGEQLFDRGWQPRREHEPKTINRLIRRSSTPSVAGLCRLYGHAVR